MPLIGVPFLRAVIDLVDLLPVSTDQYEYILTMVDMATTLGGLRLRLCGKISADKVAEAMFDIFTRFGFQKKIQYDRGSQFMSQLLQEFNAL